MAFHLVRNHRVRLRRCVHRGDQSPPGKIIWTHEASLLVTVLKLPANCVVARPPEYTSRAAPPASKIRHKEPSLPRIVTTATQRWEDVCPSQSQAQRKCSPHCYETTKHKRLRSHVQASSTSTACSVSQHQYIPSGRRITPDGRPDSSTPIIRLVVSNICSLHC